MKNLFFQVQFYFFEIVRKLFCRPLDIGSVVKERFDAIFGAVKYNKCLEHVKKIRKSYNDGNLFLFFFNIYVCIFLGSQNNQMFVSELKVLKADLHHLNQYKTEAGQKRTRLSETEIRMFECNQKIETFLSKLKPIEGNSKENYHLIFHTQA